MTEDEVRDALRSDNMLYMLACRITRRQGLLTDRLSFKLKRELPRVLAELVNEVEAQDDARQPSLFSR